MRDSRLLDGWNAEKMGIRVAVMGWICRVERERERRRALFATTTTTTTSTTSLLFFAFVPNATAVFAGPAKES